MTANVYHYAVTPDAEQRRNSDRLTLRVGDAYEYVMRRLYEAERDEDMITLGREFAGAANLFDQAAIVQRWQADVNATAAPSVRR